MTDEDEVIRQAMSAIGRRTSDRKRVTSAENGKKGGRPRKSDPVSGRRGAKAPAADDVAPQPTEKEAPIGSN